jgi:tetratricopeptide (TPR) repeat protein
MAALRRSIALNPDLGSAYSRLGNLLYARGEHDEAEECFRRASELLTEPAEHDLERAKLLLAQGQTDEAEPLLRNVIALDPANSLAHAILGDVMGQQGQFHEAAALLRKATELDPDRIGAWHNLTILTKVSEADRPLVETMEEMLSERGGRISTKPCCISRLARPITTSARQSRPSGTSTMLTRSSDAG